MIMHYGQINFCEQAFNKIYSWNTTPHTPPKIIGNVTVHLVKSSLN